MNRESSAPYSRHTDKKHRQADLGKFLSEITRLDMANRTLPLSFYVKRYIEIILSRKPINHFISLLSAVWSPFLGLFP